MGETNNDGILQHELPTNFITAYFVGGYPTKEKSIDIIKETVQSCVDAVEVGFPSDNPYLDGMTIRRAHKEVVHDFSTIDKFIHYLKRLGAAIDVPIWVMGYEEDLLAHDYYIHIAQSSYVDGFVIPNLSIKKFPHVQAKLQRCSVSIIPVINESMDNETIGSLVDKCDVVYCQLYTGKTGSRLIELNHLPLFYKRMRHLTEATLMAGFGINDADIAGKIFDVGYDGIVVGSEIVRIVSTHDRVLLNEFIHDLVIAKKE